MNTQLLLVALFALGALAWLLRSAFKGDCASGCGGCRKDCAARRLQPQKIRK